ncbi:hypothetical protein EMIHUDRAFT_241671 [Emiliania huxleyi CCMP1516]|uniref:Uncharacterized protein n=2 Tax=Emiliania huxleyi TaxID=2903 RepID=A0A0D3JC82_EMIH1|nr:hypothetical protein EMIHUDRAFT_241671 [Emiliania huxleyi CCMP1516]EOD21117.1 hypothetical protein EMIHUDRAFT_241671 [Emiliania huxleyi CCMP1516]|eukprot:XP_005773546.1 hypothetical protein EMIHUDRAFT_241671 [Emiliania huxleyi CCMP1516]
MPKASPSKAPLPKPKKPKEVKDVALNTMRVVDYQAKLAVYEEEMAAYKAGQRRREADKVAVKRRLSAGDAEPAAKRSTPARLETPEACAAGSAEAPRAPPAEPLRRLPQVLREEKEAAAAVEPEARGDGVELLGGPRAGERGNVTRLRRCDGGAPSKEPCCCECGHTVTSREAPGQGTCDVCLEQVAAGDDIDAALALAASVAGELPAGASKRQRALYAIKMNMVAAPEREAEATKAEGAARRPTRHELAAAVAGGWSKLFAEQAGVDGMGYPWDGDWCDEDASDYDEEYLPSHREDVLFDLEDGGPWGARPRRPTAAELAPLAWPHSYWWHDRDRIVLLYMHMLDNPPDGSFLWEARVFRQGGGGGDV